MKVRRINLAEDYEIIRTWWERRGSPAPQPVLLPETGVISELDGVPMACAFLYEAKGDTMAMIEWEATNPDCKSAMTTIRALNMIFDFFEKYTRGKGISILFSWVKVGRGDGRLLERRKWQKCPGDRHELMAFMNEPKEAVCP